MVLLTPGYWQSTYWPSQYWQEDYWPEYGTIPPTLTVVTATLPPHRKHVKTKKGLNPQLLSVIQDYLEMKLSRSEQNA